MSCATLIYKPRWTLKRRQFGRKQQQHKPFYKITMILAQSTTSRVQSTFTSDSLDFGPHICPLVIYIPPPLVN